MRATLDKMARMALVAMAIGTTSPAFALEDATALRCDSTLARNEARFFGCLAQCREKADKFGSASDLARCAGRCERKYEHGLGTPRCSGSARDRVGAEMVTTVDAEALRCSEAVVSLEGKRLNCLADCAELVEFAARRGTPIDPAVCIDRCEENDADAAARLEARGECTLGSPAE